MRDLIFSAAVIAFFVLAALFVRGCAWILEVGRARGGRTMSGEDVVGLVAAIAVLAYLVYALLAPERLG